MRWYGLEKLINLYDGYRRVVSVAGKPLLLLQEDGRRYLVAAHCPHYGQALDKASVSGERITCNMHGYGFDLHSGRGVDATGAPVNCQLACYTLEYRDQDIGIWC